MFRWLMHFFGPDDFWGVIRRMRPILLLTLLIIGALAALAVREKYLVKFEARISLPMSGDLATFREAEPLFSSAELFAKYGAKRNISGHADFQMIREQFARHRNSPIHIEHAFRLSRKDVRNLPEFYSSKDEIGRRIGFDGIQSDVEVSAKAGDPESAIRLAKLAMDYVRDSLAAASIASSMRRWGQGARTELAVSRESTAKLRTDLASIDRRLEMMAHVRDRYKEEKDDSALSSSLTASPPVQFQIAGTRNLSPYQQMIGLEADRADIIERLQSAELDRLRLETFLRFSDLYGSRVNDGASIDLAKEMLEQAKQSREAGKKADPKETALAGVAMQMQTVLSRFDEARPDALEPEAVPSGVSRPMAILGGMIAGAAIWWVLLLIFRAARSRPDGSI
jgi:hypothetical protein